jgi:hypothetical protein
MKRYFLLTSLSLLLVFIQKTTAQTSVLNEGIYYPLNGSYANFPAIIDNNCTSWHNNSYQPCNRGTVDEAGVANGAYLFSGNAFSPEIYWNASPGNFFPFIQSYTNFNNGMTIAFSFKLTRAGDPNANRLGGTVLDGTYEDGFSPNIYNSIDPYNTYGYQISAGTGGVTFDCYFGSNNTTLESLNTSFINGTSTSPFTPQTDVWYHVVCKLIRISIPENSFGGYTIMQIYINNNL